MNETKENLLKLGTSYFSHKGYNGSGIKEILEEAGVPKGSFYHYFKSKEDYLANVLSYYSENLFAQFDDKVANLNLTPVQKLKAIYVELTHLFNSYECEKGCLMGSMSTEVSGQSEVIRQKIIELYKLWRDKHEALIKEAQNLGELRDDLTAKELTDIFWNQWQGALLRAQLEKNTNALEQAIQITFDYLYKVK